MTQEEIIAYNEHHALEKIRAACAAGDVAVAMEIVHISMGIDDVKEAYNKVLELSEEVQK